MDIINKLVEALGIHLPKQFNKTDPDLKKIAVHIYKEIYES